MIKSFTDKETEKIYNQIFSKKIPQSIQRVALRKLIMIDNAGCLEDLRGHIVLRLINTCRAVM